MVVEAEIARKGMAVRTALGLAQRARPGLVDAGVRALLPDFARALDPFHARYLEDGEGTFRDYLVAREGDASAALLAVTDAQAARVHNRAVRAAYDRLRGRGEREVKAALPAIATVISRHLGESSVA